MRRKIERNLISEMRDMLGMNANDKKLMVENVVFGESDYDVDDFDGEFEPEDNFQPANNGSVDEIIKNIRIMALKGIAQLAETPESPQYDLLKKVWQLIDKTVEQKKDTNNVKKTVNYEN